MEIQTKMLQIIEIHHREGEKEEVEFRREGKMHIVVDVVEVQVMVVVTALLEEEAATLDLNILNELRIKTIYLANVVVRIVVIDNV